jgi:hypothetical protein
MLVAEWQITWPSLSYTQKATYCIHRRHPDDKAAELQKIGIRHLCDDRVSDHQAAS